MSNTTVDSTPVPNTLNLEDNVPFAAVFFIFLIIAQLYVIYRILALWVKSLELISLFYTSNKNWMLVRYVRLKGLSLKIGLAIFPGFFAFLLMVRTINHPLNNACQAVVPLAYLLRALTHTALLAVQLRALLVIRCVFFYMGRGHRHTITFIALFTCLMLPPFIFVILTWAFKLGVQLQGVCTLGGEVGMLGISYWVWASQGYEFAFLLFNCITDLFLHQSPMALGAKLELRRATRLSTGLLLYDTLFRFNMFQKLLSVIFQSNPLTYALSLKICGLLFAIIYTNGTAIIFAWSFEYQRINYFKLYPWNKRFWLLLFRKTTIPSGEIELYKRVKEERAVKYADLDKGRQLYTGSFRDHSSGSTQNSIVEPPTRNIIQDDFLSDQSDVEVVNLPDLAQELPTTPSSSTLHTTNFQQEQEVQEIKDVIVTSTITVENTNEYQAGTKI